MNLTRAAAFAVGFALRWTWLLFLPVFGILALFGVLPL